MNSVKTAISLGKGLFDSAEKLARELKISRSRLFAIALQDYIDRRKNLDLLNRINAASRENPDEQELRLRRKMKRAHRRMVEGEW